MIGDSTSLRDLRADFLQSSTSSMPLAGLIVWTGLGIAAELVAPRVMGMLALYVMAFILPVAFVIERSRGRMLFAGGNDNPLVVLFLTSIIGIGLTVPVVVMAARGAHEPTLIVLGMAILAGVIWIPYGWAAGDPVGLRHAIVRALGAYLAYALVPDAHRASAICAVVAASYVYSLTFMKQTGPTVQRSASPHVAGSSSPSSHTE